MIKFFQDDHYFTSNNSNKGRDKVRIIDKLIVYIGLVARVSQNKKSIWKSGRNRLEIKA